jgi:hypothetical protein
MASKTRSTLPERVAKRPTAKVEKPPTTQPPQLDWRDLPTFFAIIGGLTVALSIARQIGFFWVLDLKLLSLLSVNDVLSNSLAAVPLTLIGSIVGLALSWVLQPPAVFRRFFLFETKNPGPILIVLISCAVSVALANAAWASSLFFLSFFIYGAAIAWLGEKGKLGVLSFQAVYWAWVIGLMFFSGASEAQQALLLPTSNYELTLTTGETQTINLLEVTSDGFIVMRNPSEIAVVPKAQVKLLKRLNVTSPHDAPWVGAERSFLFDAWDRLKQLWSRGGGLPL